MEFNSRRSCVVSLGGSVAASQPLAAEIGSRILQKGGNAADAAVAVAAALNCTEPWYVRWRHRYYKSAMPSPPLLYQHKLTYPRILSHLTGLILH